MAWEVALGIGEWLAWSYLVAPAILNGYNRLLLWLWYLTAQMQAKIDERNDL
jgi:hypothetical protein